MYIQFVLKWKLWWFFSSFYEIKVMNWKKTRRYFFFRYTISNNDIFNLLFKNLNRTQINLDVLNDTMKWNWKEFNKYWSLKNTCNSFCEILLRSTVLYLSLMVCRHKSTMDLYWFNSKNRSKFKPLIFYFLFHSSWRLWA